MLNKPFPNKPITIRPASSPPILMSKNTFSVTRGA